MTFTEAAAEVLRIAGKALHYKEITELAIEKNLLSHVGKSPEVTMGARLAAMLKKDEKGNAIIRVKPGVFALREWDGKKKKRGATAGDSSDDVASDADDDDADGTEVNALEVEAATSARRAPPVASHRDDEDDDDEPLLVSGEDALRADLAASGAELFDEEDDDDQPILSGSSSAGDATRGGTSGPATAAGEAGEGGRRRRRRRRRRGGRDGSPDERGTPARDDASPDVAGGEARVSASTDNDFQADASNASKDPRDVRDSLAPSPRPMVRERHQIMAGGGPTGIEIAPGEGEDLSGRELADATVMILSGFDRQQGPVQVRSIVDALFRRGRLGAENRDTALATAQLMASLRADNLRRSATGQRPRFRVAQSGQGTRIALTDWFLSSELVRLELDAMAAVERYREASRRAMLRKVQELPGHALLELVLLGLERVGMSSLRAVRRAGAAGGESHFAALHKTGLDEVRTAIVIRKDGREVGRERVSDLRGALHHYGSASAGWLITTGQILSGAREEAAAPASPIALFDGIAVCKLLEDNDVAVVRTRLTTAIPDVDLFEALRG